MELSKEEVNNLIIDECHAFCAELIQKNEDYNNSLHKPNIFGQDPSFGNPDSTFFADIQLGIFAHRYGIPLVPIRGVQWVDYDLLPKGFPDAPILAQHLPSIGTLDKHHNDSAAFTSFAAKEFSRFCDIFVDQNQAFLFGTTT